MIISMSSWITFLLHFSSLTYDYRYGHLIQWIDLSHGNVHLHATLHSNKFSRFVQFGADQDCHCGAVGCRRKLGVKPNKPKISSDAALKLVARQVVVSSPNLKALFPRKDVCVGSSCLMICTCFLLC